MSGDTDGNAFLSSQAIMLAVMKKLTYDDEYNFENEVSLLYRRPSTVTALD